MTRNEELFARAQKSIPGGVNSPVRAFRSVGGTPRFFTRGEGARVWDADGKAYLDYVGSWGPLILGHADPEVVAAVQAAAARGLSFGAPTEAEIDLAELLVQLVPSMEMVRLVSSGTEATMSAIRLARGFTGRDLIVKFEGCYHGHNDALLARAGSGLLTLSGNIAEASSPGVPDEIVQNTLVLPLDDSAAFEQALEKHGEKIACVIIEPVPANAGLLLQRRAFIEHVLTSARQKGILVIFDEVISGFRLSFGGYAGRENLKPDIITYGKIIGGGLPVGAIAGSAAIMDNLAPQGAVYQAGTLSGNPLAMAAGHAALQCLAERDGAAYLHLKKLAARLKEAFESDIAPLFSGREWTIELVQDASLFWFSFRPQGDTGPVRRVDRIAPFSGNIYKRIFHAMLDRGVYLAPSAYEVGFLNVAMRGRDIDYFTDSLRKTVRQLPGSVKDFA